MTDKIISRETRDKLLHEPQSRSMTFARKGMDEDARTIPVSISSEEPYRRFFGNEVLVHETEAIDMVRASRAEGLPLRIDHRGKLIGRVKNITLKNRRLEGVAHFSKNSAEAREAWDDVRDGFISDTSVEYDIIEISENVENDDNTVKVTRWRPVEASIVAVPADATVGVNRTREVKVMTTETTDQGAAPKKKGDELNIADFEAARKAGKGEGFEQGQRAATERITKIYRSYEPYLARAGVSELRQTCIDENTSAERANELLLEWLGGDPEPASRTREQAPSSHGTVQTIADEADKWTDGVTRALELKADLFKDPDKARDERRNNEFFSMSLYDMARDYLVRNSMPVKGLDRMGIVGGAFTRAGGGQFGTSDFANILGNTASKSMLMGWDEAAETWRTWCRIGSLSDFKVADRVNLSSFSDLEEILESDEYKRGAMSDLKETIQLGTYGKMFPISRQAIINDDLQAFTAIPRKMGRAANRKVGDVAYALLTGNPTLNQDSTALFHADHSNLGSAGAISETTLDAFGALMAAQTSPAPRAGETGATLNIAPKYLLVPRALLMSATKAIRTVTAPVQGTNTGDLTVNTQYGMWTPVWDARLDAYSATTYFALADQNLFDTVEIAFLDGVEEPFLDSDDGWNIDGVEYKVRIDVAGAVLDYRGAARNTTS